MDHRSANDDHTAGSVTGANLPRAGRDLHRALIEGLLATGAVPSREDLVRAAGIEPAALPALLDDLVAADYICTNGAGEPVCVYPLSTVPTPHVVVVDGQPRHAMCAIDALGFPAMLDRVLTIEAECAVCRERIDLVVRPGELVTIEPATTVVAAHRDKHEPAFSACCPFTVFACGEAHGQAFVARTSRTHLLTPAEALVQAEVIFAGMLRSDTLPARRRRWGTPLSAGHGNGPDA